MGIIAFPTVSYGIKNKGYYCIEDLEIMKKRIAISLSETQVKVILWVLIAVYTYFLPEARRVYDAIVAAFGETVAGKVPLVSVILVGLGYAYVVMRTTKDLKNLLFMIPCGVISFLIMILVENPNKHIHIPEYVLMAWLLFTVLSKDYQSKDIYILIFVATSLLGVVDELEQGLHSSRFYGWIDMAVNSSSALIGVFTIMGLRKMAPANWCWTQQLKKFRIEIGLISFGLIGAIIMCVFLFQVQASEMFWGVYPNWLLGWNITFLAATLVLSVVYLCRRSIHARKTKDARMDFQHDLQIARLWITPLLVILFYMHFLIVYLFITGLEFA